MVGSLKGSEMLPPIVVGPCEPSQGGNAAALSAKSQVHAGVAFRSLFSLTDPVAELLDLFRSDPATIIGLMVRFLLRIILLVTCCGIVGCTDTHLQLATTTSTRDSGLLDVLLPEFEKTAQVEVKVIAVGTGRALKLGENGDVDVVFVHARQAEDAFMKAKHGVRREDVMYNMFVILGPASDPARIKGVSAQESLLRIAQAKANFVSRGDESGTHKREQQLWSTAGKMPEGEHYFETGQGMGASLNIAEEKQAYILSDFGTYLKWKSKLSLVPLVNEGDNLRNPYGVMCVNPSKSSDIQAELADQFVDYLISPTAQNMIKDYQVDGEPLFRPLRLKEPPGSANSN